MDRRATDPGCYEDAHRATDSPYLVLHPSAGYLRTHPTVLLDRGACNHLLPANRGMRSLRPARITAAAVGFYPTFSPVPACECGWFFSVALLVWPGRPARNFLRPVVRGCPDFPRFFNRGGLVRSRYGMGWSGWQGKGGEGLKILMNILAGGAWFRGFPHSYPQAGGNNFAGWAHFCVALSHNFP